MTRHKKIHISVSGMSGVFYWVRSTTEFATCEDAKEQFLKSNPETKPERVKCRFAETPDYMSFRN